MSGSSSMSADKSKSKSSKMSETAVTAAAPVTAPKRKRKIESSTSTSASKESKKNPKKKKVTGSRLPIDTQISRLIADIKKDSIASNNTVSSGKLERLLKIMFPSTSYSEKIQGKINLLSSGSQNYINELERIDSNDLKRVIISYNEHFQLNVLSSDLVHACASDATFVFPETGLSPSKAVMNDPDNPMKVIGTAAGYLDPGSGSTEINRLYMPKRINFDSEDLMENGFPDGMKWEATRPKGYTTPSETEGYNLFEIHVLPEDIYDVEIVYPTAATPVKGLINKNGVITGALEPLCLGNAEKNSEIETGGDDNKAINLLLTKELGDVAQVLTYDDFVSQNKRVLQKQSVMITTDHVVYMLCKELNLSCIYTGAQKLRGTMRVSGHSHIVTYVGGEELTPEKKRERAIKFHQTNLTKYLNNKKFLINLCLFNIPRIQYIEIVRSANRFSYVKSKFNLTEDQIETFLKKKSTEIDEAIEGIKGESLDAKSTESEINVHFERKKETFDTDFDLIIYQKYPFQKFIATDIFLGKLRALEAAPATAVGGGKSILNFSDIYNRRSEIFKNIFEEKSKDRIITIESAVFILYIMFECKKPSETAAFNILYHKHKKDFSDYIKGNKDYIFELLQKISESFDKDIDYVADCIIFTAQNIAERMGLYTLDYYDEVLRSPKKTMTPAALASALTQYLSKRKMQQKPRRPRYNLTLIKKPRRAPKGTIRRTVRPNKRNTALQTAWTKMRIGRIGKKTKTKTKIKGIQTRKLKISRA
jgi:hypothetical protein